MTRQIPDTLIYRRRSYDASSYFMDGYFELHPDKNFELYPEKKINRVMSTALWRGYRAVFHFKKGQLFVKDVLAMSLDTESKSGWVSILNDLFPGSKKVFWLSTLFRLDGPFQNYCDKPSRQKFEVLEIRNGLLIKLHLVNQRQFEKIPWDDDDGESTT